MKKLVVLAMFVSFSAMADQCQLVSKSMAKKALLMAVETTSLKSFCELCGDEKAKTINVKEIAIADANYGNFWELKINGKTQDLAYTYVNGLNLAKLVGCKTHDVAPAL